MTRTIKCHVTLYWDRIDTKRRCSACGEHVASWGLMSAMRHDDCRHDQVSRIQVDGYGPICDACHQIEMEGITDESV